MVGVYKITNPKGEVYIGQSKNIKNRWACHRYNVKHNKKIWGKLYDSFLNYGIKNHNFDIVCKCEINELDKFERMYQDKYNSFEIGLNSVLHKSENEKVKYSKTSIAKMSEKAKVKVFSEKHLKNMSKNRIGGKNGNAKIVLDYVNGIYYETSKEVSKLYKISHSHFSAMMNGKKTNKTNFIYV